MVKQIVVHTYHWMLLSNKRQWTTDTHNNLDEFLGNYAKWKKANQQKGYHASIYVTFMKWQNFRNGRQISGCQCLGSGMGYRREVSAIMEGKYEGFLWWWTVHYLDCGCGYTNLHMW